MYAHHPSENWIKYLILFSGAALDKIQSVISLNGVVAPPLGYLQCLQDELNTHKPNPFYLRNETTRKWLRRHRLFGLATNTRDAMEARSILSEDKLRKVLESLLICGTPFSEVPTYIKSAGLRKISVRVVETYAHYFWNRRLLTAKDWLDFLKDPYPNGALYTDCYVNDTEYTAWKLGIKLELEAQDVLKTIFADAAMRFKETRHAANDRNTALSAKLWSEIVFGAHIELTKSSDATREILEQLKKMAIKLDDRKVPSLETLSMIENIGKEGDDDDAGSADSGLDKEI